MCIRDREIMQVTKNLPNSIYGHTISPHVGGGTNSSEYEMLSSNSLMLMPVSYTHLDVYKRQLRACWCRISSTTLAPPCSMAAFPW